MTNLLIIYVATFFLPVLFPSWRVAVMGLGVQGLLLALIVIARPPHTADHAASPLSDPTLMVEFVSSLLIRAVFVPYYLVRKMRGEQTSSDFVLVQKSLPRWFFAFALLGVAFLFGRRMSPDDSQEALQVGTAAAAILTGLLILTNQHHPIGQIVGLLVFEGGVTLVELLSSHAMPLSVELGVSLVFVILVLTCGQYLKKILTLPPQSAEEADKEGL